MLGGPFPRDRIGCLVFTVGVGGGGCYGQGPPASDVTTILVTVLVCGFFESLTVYMLFGLEFVKWTRLASAS